MSSLRSAVHEVCQFFRHVLHLWRWFKTKADIGSECLFTSMTSGCGWKN